MPFRSIVALTPVLVAVHNLEEYPRIVAYARQHGVRIDTAQMGVAVALATLLPIPLTLLAVHSPPQSRRMMAGLLVPAMMAANAASHVGQTVLLRDYSPGTLSAIGLNVPFAIYLYRRALRERYLRPSQLRRMIVWGAVLMAPSALILQSIGWLTMRFVRS